MDVVLFSMFLIIDLIAFYNAITLYREGVLNKMETGYCIFWCWIAFVLNFRLVI